jgi:hypothetical protein
MLIKIEHWKTLLLVMLGFLLIFSASCDRKGRYTGIYLAKGEELQEHSEAYIELKENGQGAWRVLDDESPFRWNVSGSQIRLHTKSGGVIIGKIQDNTLEITLPNRDIMYFKKRD